MDFVKLAVISVLFAGLAGCSANPAMQPQKSMISAAEFEAMITIEVRELEPLPVENALAAN